ncbi:dynamin family protein [Paenisporosarcina indica]|uniref:dynamin family protein n=1 Tax=Paenisporosarcina indica TaxID=650093 RepID=UPI00094F9778|nr:dynamin family protein [Paenisporosarcina indica]
MQSFNEKLNQSLEQTALAFTLFKESNDVERLNKTSLFAQKLINREFTIGFAGHFSAGKSSMINALTGEQLLPSSPIPTSANIVKIHKATEDYAIVYMHGQKPVKFSGDYNFETVKAFCKDGEIVSQIEIGHETSVLPEGITVMDTPGVDSTDDAHRMSTESALHLADIVFYVMDYNHVQSEMNFGFTKQLLKYNDNVYLIVNQIDKHRDNELSFEAFKQSVYESFNAWGVDPKGIYFTTLKEPTHAHNDFSDVQNIVMDSMKDWQQQLLNSAERTMKKLHDEHLSYLEDEKEECLQTFSQVLSETEWQSKDDIRLVATRYSKQSSLLSSTSWIDSFDQSRKTLLENATLMPYELRDTLKLYLESKQEDFKVGLLFSGKKTEQERSIRAGNVMKQYSSVVQSQIVTHLKTLMKQSLKDVGLLTDTESMAIDELIFEPTQNVIDDQIQKSALLTADSVLNFANGVADATRRWFIRETEAWKNEKAIEIDNLPDDETVLADAKSLEYQEKVLAINTIEEMEFKLKTYIEEQKNPSTKKIKLAIQIKENWLQEHSLASQNIQPYDESMLQKEPTEVIMEENMTFEETTNQYSIEQTINSARKVSSVISSINGFEEVSSYLKKKADRLTKQDFTIALFGAFSAGKSSFSNALMGANVLPVSPNPTTAAINKIRPVSEHHPHATADVKLKTADQLLHDVQLSFKEMGMSVLTLQQAFEKSREIEQVKLEDEGLHVHKAFIRAFSAGYSTFKEQLGTTIRVDRPEFELFVAQENKSCFVDTIDFYYDCELTRMGVTLVDTPGADSINARHTGVAFDYIRNADAILFITYYNHAFAHADREFLIQLGRVKDAFELDKMFFVVNAIDLASNEKEANEVKNYVTDELQRFGIRFPRVHGVSSLQALEEKVTSIDLRSGMADFEQSFHQFLSEDLKALAVQALAEETEKTVGRLATLIEQTELNLVRKEERLQELNMLEQTLRKRYGTSAAAVITKDVFQELEELLHYVLQRVYYRYPDFFKESYNPSVFSNKPSVEALQYALKETLAMLSFDFEQEMRVTNFRLVHWISKKITERQQEEVYALKELNGGFSLLPYEITEPTILEFEGPFKDSETYQHVKSHYKNNKAFFEKNEKEKLRDALQNATKPDAEHYLNSQKRRIQEWAEQIVDLEAEGLRQHLLHQALEQIDSERTLLQEENRLKQWKSIYTELSWGV